MGFLPRSEFANLSHTFKENKVPYLNRFLCDVYMLKMTFVVSSISNFLFSLFLSVPNFYVRIKCLKTV